MTYSPGSSGYPPAQSPAPYGASTPAFAKADDGESKLKLYLTIVVVALGLAAYLATFGPTLTLSADLGPSGGEISGDIGMGVPAALLAALLAGVGLLPKAKNYLPIVTVVSALGALVLIGEILNKPSGFSIGWGLWLAIAFVFIQALVAVGALLLDAGVITPPAPRPKYDQYSQYGQYGGYYGQPGPQHAPYQQQGPQQSGYGSQYGGYPAGPTTGGFGAAGTQQTSHQGPQHGTSTPPTGFPSFTPPSYGSSPTAEVTAQPNSGNHGGQTQHGQHSQGQPPLGQGQQPQSPSSSSGPAQS